MQGLIELEDQNFKNEHDTSAQVKSFYLLKIYYAVPGLPRGNHR